MTFKSQDTSCSVRIEENVPAPVTLHGVMYSLEMFPNIGQQSHERLLLLDLLQTLDVLESRPLTRAVAGAFGALSRATLNAILCWIELVKRASKTR